MINRRDAILAAALAPITAASGTTAANAAPTNAGSARVAPPDLSFLRSTPLVDADRLRFFMREAQVDALVVSHPANVFYLSNHWPQLDRMGSSNSAIAIIAADPRRPLTLVMNSFLYYYTHSPESDFTDRLIFPYTQPVDVANTPAGGSEPTPVPGRTMKVRDPALFSPREQHRAAAFAAAKPVSADASWALKKALTELGLSDARIGIDEPELAGLLQLRGVAAGLQPCENLLRRARMAKSPAELRLMRLAAQANVDAALAAATRARALGSTRLLRAEFFAEAARRGNSGVFMVINGSSAEVIDEPIRDGMGIAIDCVSTCRFYHGDFARTIFVGEPPANVGRAAKAIAIAWGEIRSQLKAGMRFADVPRIGRESLRKQGADFNVSFTPHSVGLFHTDHPDPSVIAARSSGELVLEENTILSVDCPVLEAGLGGTLHLEDLMLILKDGAEPIHSVPQSVIHV